MHPLATSAVGVASLRSLDCLAGILQEPQANYSLGCHLWWQQQNPFATNAALPMAVQAHS